MGSRWYNIAVVVLWLSAMGWLLHQKVLPSLLVGEPPSYPEILRAEKARGPAAWKATFEGRGLGWAVSTTESAPGDATMVRSFVHFDFQESEIREAVPPPLQRLLAPAGSAARIVLDVDTLMNFDSLGSLFSFDSKIPDVLRISGEIQGSHLRLNMRWGEQDLPEKILPAPRSAMLSDSMSPQSHLPNLRLGQTWTMAIYKPFGAFDNPTEILHAKVDRETRINYNGTQANAWVVVYRSDPGTAARGEGAERAKLLVRKDDGTVVRQELSVLGRWLAFDRLPDGEAARLASKLPDRYTVTKSKNAN